MTRKCSWSVPRRGPALALLGLLGLILLAAAPAAAETAATTPEPGTEEFVIGVEDRLRIAVWKDAELSLTVIVRPDGMITMPLVGDVRAAGRTARQLSSELTEALSTFIKEPIVTLIVEQINHFQVYVLGEVATQGVLQLTRPTRLLQAIAMSGGLGPFADKSNITIVRYQGGQEQRVRVDYRKILSGQQPEANIFLEPGDTIIVK